MEIWLFMKLKGEKNYINMKKHSKFIFNAMHSFCENG